MVTPPRRLLLLLAYSILPFALLKYSAGAGWRWNQIGRAIALRELPGGFRPGVSRRSFKKFIQRESQFFEWD
jgi:hypothetical protein